MATIVPLFTNAFSTTLASSVASGATTSFSLSSVTGLPTIGTDQYVPAVVVDASTTPETVKEYVHITAVSGTTATVVRAAEDATRFPAAALASGLVVAAVVTQGTIGPRPMYGTAAAKPAATTVPNGYRYTETDTGIEYEARSGVWVAILSDLSGSLAAGPVFFTGTFDILAVGTTVTDISGLSLSIPASANHSIAITFPVSLTGATGTAAANSQCTPQIQLTDSSNAFIDGTSDTFQQVSASSVTIHKTAFLRAILAAPVSAQTVKLRAKLRNAAPANWSSMNLSANFGGGGVGDAFEATYL